jgi:hypothetical protein
MLRRSLSIGRTGGKLGAGNKVTEADVTRDGRG